MKKLLLILPVLLLLLSVSAFGTDRLVPSQYATIQLAINAADPGDNIIIDAGTYNQALTIGKSVTLIGSGPASNPTTIITSTANPIISLSVTGISYSFRNLIIEGNVTNNGIRAGGSININSLTLQDVIARNCQVALYLAEYWPGNDPLTTTVNTLSMDNVTMTNNKFIGAYIGKTVLSGIVTNSTFTNNGYSNDLPDDWQKTGLQFVNFDETSVPHVIVTNSTFINNGAGASNIERTGLILYSAYNALSTNELLTVSGCTFQDHPLYAVRVKNGYQVGNTSTINGTFTNNFLDIWFNRVVGYTSTTTKVRRTLEGIKTVGTGPTYDYNTIQAAIAASAANDIIQVAAGTYTEIGQIIINKNLTISGADKLNTIIKPAQNTGTSGDDRGFVLVQTGNTLNLNGVTIDGSGKLVNIGILSHGPGTISNCIVKNISMSASGQPYAGRGIAFYDVNMTISNNTLTNIGRIGMYCYGTGVTNGIIQGNTFTGKGLGDWLDYGIEIEGGAIANCTNNVLSNCKGVAYDGSTSAGVLLTTYFAPGTTGNFSNNTFSDNYVGINVGYDGTDQSIAVAHNNSFTGNSFGINSTNPSVNATYNWWGNATGPYHLTLNPTGTGDAVSDHVNFTPWIGSLEAKPITNTDLNTPVNFTTANTSLTFTSLPPATNATVTVQRIESTNPPTGVPGYPHSAGNGLPLYLMITATGLTNYTFSVTVVIDVSNINGFNPNTEVMYYSTASNSWVGIDGLYSPSAKTFTFTTDHFTPFGFVNPTNPNDIYLSQIVLDPVNTQKWYPAVDMGAPGIPSPDWNYVNAKATYYVVPTGTTGMFSSKFAVVWDKSKANLTVTAGDYWGTDQMFYSIDSSVGNNGRYWVNVASTDLTNQVPGGGKYIAKLDFTNIKPGYIPVSIDGTDFRYFANDEQQGVYVTTHPGKILFYLGDVAKLGNETMGDGKIQFEDLTLFSGAYWSILGTHPSYKYKYDIGPTNANGSYWALPTPDGRIEFEDLNIFAIGYGKTGAGQLPDNPGENKMNISTLAMKYENGYFKVPVKVSGVVNDFRTGSFEFGYSSGELEYAGFEKKGGFEGDDNFMLSKTENNKIMLDAAIVGAEKTGMNGEQIIMNLLFTEKQSGSHNVNVLTARARNSGNTPIDISFDGSNGASSEIPTTFTLNQNYPNPFNPGTTIKYGLPKDAKVSLVVFDILGRKVMTLVNDNQKAGYHEVQFNALNLSSGTYFYRIIAGDFTSIKRMVLLK